MSWSSDSRCCCSDDSSSSCGIGLMDSRHTLTAAHKPTSAWGSLQPKGPEMHFLARLAQNPCRTCNKPMRVFSRVKIAETKAGLGWLMNCALCRSSNLREFGTEILIHFCGLKNLDKPPVWAFPKLLVCLDCGSS